MITYLKLGGSVLTEKNKEKAARHDTIQRIASELVESIKTNPTLKLLLGHGSGSFGHSTAAKFSTHRGARSNRDWKGFSEVWLSARELNSILIKALQSAGLPVISFPPSASALSDEGQLISMATDPIADALKAGLVPMVYGDVVFDRTHGAAIASTEQVFAYLMDFIQPGRLLLAGREEGVFDLSGRQPIILSEITPAIRAELQFVSPEVKDVTGGMASKVDLCLEISRTYPDLEILIFSAEPAGQLTEVLSGGHSGTRIRV
jgi:isopentenyl phosphate kinase